MRHSRKSEKFSRPRAQRKALIKSLLRAMIINESIRTTDSKAKGIRPWVDKLVGLGKENTLHSKRQAYKLLDDHALVKRLCDEIAPRFKDINGGYTRVIGFDIRPGDGAKMSLIEFTMLKKKEAAKKKKTEKKEPTVADAKAAAADVNKEAAQKEGFMKGVKGIFKKEKKQDR